MAKIFSGLTLLVALAAIFFGFKTKELVETLQIKGQKEHDQYVAAKAELKTTKEKLKATEDTLAQTQAELKASQDKLVATEADLAKAKTDLADANTKKDAAEAQYAAVKKNFDDLQAALGDKKPEEILKEVTDMKEANKSLTAKVATLENDVASQKIVIEDLTKQKKGTEIQIADQKKHLERYISGVMQKGTHGQVLAVNAGWGFCVVSLGDKRGAAANKILIVVRNGQAIGKVRIINVEASQSVADIIPSSFTRGMYVQPGDQVIYTGEEKVREEATPAGQNTPGNSNGPSTPSTQPSGVPELPSR